MKEYFSKRFSHTSIFSTTYLLKKLDAICGKVAVKALAGIKKKKTHSLNQIGSRNRRILVIRPGGIGDAVMLVPTLKALHEKFGNSEIHVLAEKRNRGVFSMVEFIRIYCYDDLRDLFRVLGTSYDLVIDTEQWHRLSAVFSNLVRASVRIGFGTNERSRLFDYSIPYSQDQFELYSFMKLLEPISILPNKQLSFPFLHPRSSVNPFGDEPFVALFPGASIPERRWPTERFNAIGKWLNKQGFGVVVVGGKEDITTGNMIVKDLKKGINLAGKYSLEETAGLLKKATLLISSDSGIMHLAMAVGIPVVALFGPGIENKWGPKDGRSVIINRHLPCSPCTLFGYTPPCPTKARCMKEITVEDVKNGVLKIIS